MDAGAHIELRDFLGAAKSDAYPAFRAGPRALTPEAEGFLTALFGDLDEDPRGLGDVEDLLAMAHDLWRWTLEIAADERAVRWRPATGARGAALNRDVLEIVGPDIPFLVDSVMGEFADQGVAALAMTHPVWNARSFIHIECAPLSGDRKEALLLGVRATLADVTQIVADFKPLKARMLACAEDLASATRFLPPDEVAESAALLQWLAADRFTFLGARDYLYARDESGALAPVEPILLPETGLGLLRDPARFVLRPTAEPMMLTPTWRDLLTAPTPLVVGKSTLRSRVHRRAAADYIGVKRYDAQGNVIGETRFVGLFTTEAFTDPAREIPLLRKKVDAVIADAGFPAGGHNEKSLRHVIETYPREEVWRISTAELSETARAIVHLMDRPRPRVFVHRDPFDRFVSALAFLPKERFGSRLREQVGHLLESLYGGRVESFSPTVNESPLARVHFVIAEIDRTRPDPAPETLDAELLRLVRTWDDDFQAALRDSPVFDAGGREGVAAQFAGAFSASYREGVPAAEALDDVAELLRLRPEDALRVRAFRRVGDGADILRCKIYVRERLSLSAMLPIFENLGLSVDAEVNYEIAPAAARFIVHDLILHAGEAVDLARVDDAFEAAFIAIWSGIAENDGFNRLILRLGIGWREAALIRALARYRQQSGMEPSQAVQEAALAAHAEITALILALFRVRFDPALPEDVAARGAWGKEIAAKIEAALKEVASLDDDRVLRRIAALVAAIVRTNYYQAGADGAAKPYMSFKIASADLVDLPQPKPFREIWVAGPLVEGVHLRMGPIARGGLRWSDRRDDFRTEVLDLVKAQQVKNSIIVPVGAKGGFFPKKLPARGAPGYQEAGIEAYRTFLRGLLDITDNLEGDRVIAPRDVVRWDNDDAYLVVAADKGTATFSDIANALAIEYGFWLGDAFASGGSAGYDHKAMGVTARGAWEAVKRHFREIGKNIQEEAFDVIGVGDMSGDVFGNGMLLTTKIRLRAAFDHRHIFLDPNPVDLDNAWAERKRMFALPRSSWDDYDKTLISAGGGVFPRTLKSIPLTPEIAALTGLTKSEATPADIIRALLTAPCELLWFGGIGTFIKAEAESHADVGDKANDGLRVNGEDVRAQAIGEGANLGVTQAGRIAYARKGGRINTDSVDNSAGVDTSDHEVNIKILLTEAIRVGDLAADARNALLGTMTDEIALQVIDDNYDQTLAMTLAEAAGADDLDSHERMVVRLEAAGKLSRTVEGLPDAEGFASLRAAHLGLTRPELSKLIAYSKIDLFDALMASGAPDDPAFHAPLVAYFPPQLKAFEKEMESHRLKRAIIATQLADDLVNLGGPTFVDRIRETARAEPAAIACAFEAARRIYALDALVERINALDNKAPAALQTRLHQQIISSARRLAIYLVRYGLIESRPLDAVIEAYAASVAAQRAQGFAGLTPLERARAEARRADYTKDGAPDDLATDIAALPAYAGALDVADVAARTGAPSLAASYLYRAIGALFSLDALRAAAAGMRFDAHWDRLAMRRTIEVLFDNQRALSEVALRALGAPASMQDAETRVSEWAAGLGPAAAASRATIAQLEADGGWSFAKLTLAAAELRTLVDAAGR